jgi:PqqD family protein of HPr-rel-A system
MGIQNNRKATMTERWKINDEVTEQQMGDELMLFDKRTDKVHVLNATSACVWGALKDGLDAAGIEERLRGAFDAGSVADVPALVQRAIGQLAEKGLVQPEA